MITPISSVTQFSEKDMNLVTKLTHEQEAYANAILNNHITFVDAKSGTGKALTNDSPVKTPNGETPIGELKVGDEVLNTYGGVSKVVGVFPQGKKEVVEVEFSDGTIIECCEDHLWEVSTANQRLIGESETKTAKEIMESPLYTPSRGHKRWQVYIPMTEPVQYSKKELPIDPYVLGVLLGDGGLSGESICVTNSERDIIKRVQSILEKTKHTLSEQKSKDKNKAPTFRVVQKKRVLQEGKKVNTMKQALQELGLMGHKAEGKFVPEIYLRSNVEDRLNLLKGLIDTDGECTGSSYEFSTVSKQLALDVQELIHSLGGTAKMSLRQTYFTHKGKKKPGQPSYRLHIKAPESIPVLHSSEKHDKTWKKAQSLARRTIRRIERTGRYEDMTCISVDSDDKLFMTTNFVVTHNTSIATQIGVSLLNRGIVKKVVYVANPVQTEALGHLKGTLVDKTIHYYMPFFDAIYKAGVSKLKYPMEDVADPTVPTDLEATTPVFMRGITIENSFIIIDEAQNFSVDDLRKIGTRITDDCILVVIGHNGQIDVKASASGFSYYMNHFKKLKEHGEFKKVEFCELTHNFRGSISKAFDNI